MRHGLVREAGYAGEAVIDDHNAKAIEPPIYYGPPDWSPRAYIDAAGYEAKYCASVTKPEASGRRRASASTGFKPYTRIKNTNFGLGPCLDTLVRGRHHQHRIQLHRPSPRDARRLVRDHLEER
jgi:hypothetical protein